MKTKLIFLLFICTNYMLAQNPKLISYQGVARGSDGSPVLNQAVSIRFNVLQGSITGSVIYTETQAVTTNERGLILTQIGKTGNLGIIDWKNGPYFLEVAADMTGGSNLQVLGVQQVVGVPYSFHASTVPSAYTASTGVLDIGGNSYTLSSTPITTITGQGRANVSNPNTNEFIVDVPFLQISTTSTAGGLAVGGAGTGTINLNIPAAVTPSIYGGGAVTVGPANVGNNFTVTVPPLGISVTQTGTTAGFASTGINSVNINMPAQVSPNIVGTGLANVTTLGNNYIVNVPALSYTASTATLGSGTNNVSILQSLGLTGAVLNSGPLTNAVNLSSITPWRQGAGTVTLTTATDRVGIGTSAPIEHLQVESSTSSTVSLLSSSAGASDLAFGTTANHGLGKVRYDNTTNTMSFWSNATSRAFINSSGQMVIGTANPYAATTALTVGRAGALNNQLMIVGGDNTNSYAGMLSFGENLNPSVGMSLKLDAGGNRLMFTNDLSGATPVMSIGGYAGAVNGVAIGLAYAPGVNPPTNGLVVQGNVGIGTTAPQSALDVVGVSTFQGSITVGTSAATPADARVFGAVRVGIETSTSQGPSYPPTSGGMITRRVFTSAITAGSTVALTPDLSFERNGLNGDFRVSRLTNTGALVCHCTGVTSSSLTIARSFNNLGATPTVIFADSDNVEYFHCMFGDPAWVASRHMTEITLARYANDYYWAGTLTSTFNQ